MPFFAPKHQMDLIGTNHSKRVAWPLTEDKNRFFRKHVLYDKWKPRKCWQALNTKPIQTVFHKRLGIQSSYSACIFLTASYIDAVDIWHLIIRYYKFLPKVPVIGTHHGICIPCKRLCSLLYTSHRFSPRAEFPLKNHLDVILRIWDSSSPKTSDSEFVTRAKSSFSWSGGDGDEAVVLEGNLNGVIGAGDWSKNEQ